METVIQQEPAADEAPLHPLARPGSASMLKEAATLVTKATKALNASRSHCDHCGRDSDRERMHAEAFRQLSAAAAKLKRWAAALDDPTKYREDGVAHGDEGRVDATKRRR